MFLEILRAASDELFPAVYRLLIIILPIVMPVFLLIFFWIIRLRALQLKTINEQKTVLLEIRLPKEIFKSPAGMEIFFQYMSQSGPGTFGEAFLDGKVKPWFSFEIVSIGGQVRFFIWAFSKYKNIIEAQLYAQYPNVEIIDAEDYTKGILFDPLKYSYWGMQLSLTKKEDYGDAYPIKTYIDYGLDRDPKDEYKIDPMTSVIEYLGSLKHGENAWIQILIQKHEKEGWKEGRFIEKPDWKEDIKTAIKEERKKTIDDVDTGDEENKKMRFPNPTKGQAEIIAALERSASKMPFDCMIRAIYVAETSAFNPASIGGLAGCFRQYGSNNLNGFKPGTKTDVSDNYQDWVRLVFPFWKNHMAKVILEKKNDMFNAYKLRSYFQVPYKMLGGKKPFILNVEELATIFHFPSGIVSQTPTLERVGSRKSEAPANLPI